jgi:predicted permease
MMRVREWLIRLCSTWRPRRGDADLEAEMRAHLELAADDEQRRGALPEQARRAAVAKVGGPSHNLDALRDQRGFRWLDDLRQDVRFGLRGIRRNPVFAVVIVLSLSLGIGANTALFSLVEGTVLRELPVESPEELVFLRWYSRRWVPWEPDSDRFRGSGSTSTLRRSPTFSTVAFDALRTQNGTLSEMFAFTVMSKVTATIDRQAHAASMQLVSGTYFSGLRVPAAIGRVLTATDDRPSADPVAVISHTFWERQFRRDPSAIGARVVLDGAAFTIVGVAAPAFRGAVALVPERPDFWVPFSFGSRFDERYAEPRFWSLSVMGRLRPVVSLEQVRGNLDGAFRGAMLSTETPPADDVPTLRVLSARRGAIDEGPEDELEHAIILGVTFSVLLLIVCLNVANLLLSRSAARRAEIGVRLALGASRGRLVRQLLTENVTLAMAGGLLGLALAYWSLGLFNVSGWVSPDLDLRLSPGVLGFTALLSIATGLFFGLIPALRTTKIRTGAPVERLHTSSASSARMSRTLLVAQVAVSLILLVGAGLFVRTLGRWQRIDTGFETRNLLVFQINTDTLGYDSARGAAVRDALVARIRTLPGVSGSTTSGPFWQPPYFGRLFVDGVEPTRNHGDPSPTTLPVRHDFFGTLGIPLLAGRTFRPEEDHRAPASAIVDAYFAQKYFGQASPIGHRIAFAQAGRDVEIVGVVGSVWMPGTQPEDRNPAIYLTERARRVDFDPKEAARRSGVRPNYPASVEVRTARDAMTLLPAIRTAVSDVDPNLAIEDPKTVADGVREILAPTRVVSLIWLAFGSVALALTAIGLYGLLATAVAQRTREIGIRTALGASRSDIIGLVTGQTLRLMTLGIAIGLPVSMAVNQLARAYIFVPFYDPITLVAGVTTLLAVTSAAALIPVRRAVRVNPAVALRWE